MDMQHPRPLMPLLKPYGSQNSQNTSKSYNCKISQCGSVNGTRDYPDMQAKVTDGTFGKESSLQVLSNHTRLQNAMARTCPAFLPKTKTVEHSDAQRYIERLVLFLPAELKADIIDFMTEMISSVKRLETVIESQKVLLKETVVAHEKKSKLLDASERSCEVYRGRVTDVEDKYATLVDVMDSKEKHSSKTQMAISRLNKANLTLTQALNSIRSSKASEIVSKNSYVKNRSDDKTDRISDTDSNDEDSMLFADGKDCSNLLNSLLHLESETAPTSPASQCIGRFSAGPKKVENTPSMTLNSTATTNTESRRGIMRERKTSLMKGEDMRNAMLKLTREKYRFTKKVEILGNEVEDLKAKLKLADLKCRHLQINLTEFTGTDSGNDFFFDVNAAHTLQTKTKDFGPQDDLFRVRNNDFIIKEIYLKYHGDYCKLYFTHICYYYMIFLYSSTIYVISLCRFFSFLF